ncbi:MULTISPECIES: TnsA-like heteromeric transposase endonuclease subunit [unclassified Frondihabitans]|uniref:TnsA-like heteromeric transposase endonuclease subunit n=1 Tax=unclassified Frondihabitans TaxID=2626248 RepID=UPI000F942253|nr:MULTISPECIES: TnsA-like heteromeric transposase endonuclease subunit [unclassified Frondihabitans]RPE77792.1 hypothetical protein EDF37_0452 [Frondihabitans sp. PhB153]RPF08071.1 hypothetical protein EDF39_0453 [Frondihabitans sp. PhB161]
MIIRRHKAAPVLGNEKRPPGVRTSVEWAHLAAVQLTYRENTPSLSAEQRSTAVQRVADTISTPYIPSRRRRRLVDISVLKRNRSRTTATPPLITKSDLANGPVVAVKVGDRVELSPLIDVSSDLLLKGVPIRHLARRREMPHRNGAYFSITDDDLVVYESQLELQQLMLADFDPTVTAIRAQPFRLYALHDGLVRRHVPDYCLFHGDGSMRIVNVKNPQMAATPDVIAFHAWVAEQLALGGFPHEEFTGVPRVVEQNLRNLAGCRSRLWLHRYPLADSYLAWEEGDTIGSLEWRLKREWPKSLLRPAIRHLIWHGWLTTDLTVTLSDRSVLERVA